MPALRRIFAATVLATTACATVVLGATAASASETKTFSGTGMNNNPFTALYYADANARALATADGFDQATQCVADGHFTTRHSLGYYVVYAQVRCTR
ncbi:hypothetical protein [Micromonospora sp. DT233]|uniref:hypothetical protein n=1 Tax=Micromonospora sp. DT233 TaxID=3393432 RepID=UPI003CFA1575